MTLIAGLACILEYRAPFSGHGSSLEGDVHAFHQHVGSALARSNYSGFGHDCGLLLRAQSSQRVVHPFHESMMPPVRAQRELLRTPYRRSSEKIHLLGTRVNKPRRAACPESLIKVDQQNAQSVPWQIIALVAH
jgi:hypothetical protein